MNSSGKALNTNVSRQKLALITGLSGVLIWILAWTGFRPVFKMPFLTLSFILILSGVVLYSWDAYMKTLPGIKNKGTWFRSLTSRKWAGWASAMIITSFYVALYWFPELIGFHEGGNTGLVRFFDPFSFLLKKSPASQWFVFGCF